MIIEITPEFYIPKKESAFEVCKRAGIKISPKWKDKAIAQDRYLGKRADGEYIILRVSVCRRQITPFSEVHLE
ncbi:hypothetical protein EHQ53_14125 [Leptospira langatensis]|uniref:Uncharacterized protein n=1 Tax=Leptospira langatensis TaxID=2484983 RepID=A0ABY2M9A9_9LEPT|nr:hypothetical protein EHQ53_14125 [Leptospira langatensis]